MTPSAAAAPLAKPTDVPQLGGPGLAQLAASVRQLSPRRCADYKRATIISGTSLAKMVGEDTIDDLVTEGVMRPIECGGGGTDFQPRVTLWNAGGLITVLPSAMNPEASTVYLGSDTLWLLDFLWKRRVQGRRAADLGSGHGFLGAALASRFDEVVAADIDATCLRYIDATLRVNGLTPPRVTAVRADVAVGLEVGGFDLVTANAPWSPVPPRDDRGVAAVWADGGHRGTALPLQFVRQGAQLLAPGGEAIVLCLDTEWDDGETPLRSGLTDLTALGFKLEMHPTDAMPPQDHERLLHKTEGLVWAEHTAVIVSRPKTDDCHGG